MIVKIIWLNALNDNNFIVINSTVIIIILGYRCNSSQCWTLHQAWDKLRRYPFRGDTAV